MKTILAVAFFLLFSGCLQSGAFFGPVITVASTGNIYQAGLSYGSNIAVQNLTGKTPMQNFIDILEPKKNENKIISSAKEKIKSVSKIEDLSSQ